MSTPKFSREQCNHLRKLFPKMDITPESTMSEIQYNAGQQYVLDHVERNTEGYRRVQVGREPS